MTVADELEDLAPELEVRKDVPDHVATAVEEALEAEPNAATEPVAYVPEDVHERVVTRITASFQEQPVLDDQGGLQGWHPAYRSRELFLTALREALTGSELMVEEKNIHTLTIARNPVEEDSR